MDDGAARLVERVPQQQAGRIRRAGRVRRGREPARRQEQRGDGREGSAGEARETAWGAAWGLVRLCIVSPGRRRGTTGLVSVNTRKPGPPPAGRGRVESVS
ncbi:hypothetical protein GCM10027612_51220 [Microbispora bryophytorum subsp. camponoti]